jgi:hypothetical protein
MKNHSFLPFFSLSEKIGEADNEIGDTFFAWLRDDFVSSRPSCYYKQIPNDALGFRYELLIGNLKANGRVVEGGESTSFKNEKEQADASHAKACPHILFAKDLSTGYENKLHTVNIGAIKQNGLRNELFNDLSLRYGLRVKKKELPAKVAEIGEVAKGMHTITGKRTKTFVEIFDPYYNKRFLEALLIEQLNFSRYLSLCFHTCDLQAFKNFQKEEVRLLSGSRLKKACADLFREDIRRIWQAISSEMPSSERTLWSSHRNLRFCLWQPKEENGSAESYMNKVRNSFHARKLQIDEKYCFVADHSFHLPDPGHDSYDEPVRFSIDRHETFNEWAQKRQFEAKKILITGADYSFS